MQVCRHVDVWANSNIFCYWAWITGNETERQVKGVFAPKRVKRIRLILSYLYLYLSNLYLCIINTLVIQKYYIQVTRSYHKFHQNWHLLNSFTEVFQKKRHSSLNISNNQYILYFEGVNTFSNFIFCYFTLPLHQLYRFRILEQTIFQQGTIFQEIFSEFHRL